MIAPTRCASQLELEGVLHERLQADQLKVWTEHIGQCKRCHHQLEQIAGSNEWWNESREHLSSIGDNEDTTIASNEPLPESLAHYDVQGVIGYGGMATVYRGFDPQLNRPVAIKVLHPHLTASGNSRQRFIREAQSAASIAHANVIAIYGVHHSTGKTFLVMPLVTGGSLQQRIDREGPLAIEDVLRIGLQIAEGLSAAHAQGVIHRDVKPANILLEDGSRRVLLSDFGLARTLDDATLTASGLIAGTPAFMSPEQARGESIDFRSDLYSLGSVLYAMCTGHSPFQATSTLRLLREVGESSFPSVHRYQEQLPRWVDALIARLTASKAGDRASNADEAASMIRDCLMHVMHPHQHLLPDWATQNDSTIRAKHRKWKQLVLAGLVLIIVSFTAGSVWWRLPKGVTPNDTVAKNSQRMQAGPYSTVVSNPNPIVPPSPVKPLLRWDDELTLEVEMLESQLDQIESQSQTEDTRK